MRYPLFALCLFLALGSYAQGRYFVYLKDKNGTTFTTNKPEEFLSQRSIDRRKNQNIGITSTDLPVSQTYLNQIIILGYKIIGRSKWLNAVLVEGPTNKFTELKSLSFVSGIENNGDIRGGGSNNARIKNKWNQQEDALNYGTSAAQVQMLGADKLHKEGFTGKGKLIAVMDAGFPNVNTAAAFEHLRTGNKIIRTYNYPANTTNVYRDHSHGTNVLSAIAGKLEGKLYGTAPDASVALYTTEYTPTETKQEPVFWVLAVEDADSLGVDVINTSLGYSIFDDPTHSYTYGEMDGKTTFMAKAADYATKIGILVVNAAGNEGNKEWKYITTPSDAELVLAVGAVNATKTIGDFSSLGPAASGNIKPEVCAMGVATVLSNSGNATFASNGTSYSSPVMAGFAASLLQRYPTLTALELRDLIIKSADRHTNPDERYGYGIPHYDKIAELVTGPILSNDICCVTAILYPNPIQKNSILNLKVGNQELGPEHKVSIFSSAGAILVDNGEIGKLDFGSFSSGIYIVRFDFLGTTYNRKISVL